MTDASGAELLDISRDNFRQRLSRARRDLHNFMHDKCGLVNTANPCRCAKKTRAFMKAGFVDPANLLFAKARLTRIREVARQTCDEISELDEAYAEVHRDHPFADSPDFVGAVRKLIGQPSFRSTLEM